MGEAKLDLNKELLVCLQCGECSGSCPLFITAPEKYNPRMIVERYLLLGVKPYDASWLCLTCYECHERCPMGVSITHFMEEMRNESSRSGYIPSGARELAANLLRTGMEVEVTKMMLRKRLALGLNPIPEGINEEVAKLLEITGFKDILEGARKK